MPGFTSRLKLPWPLQDNSEAPTGPAQIKALADALDGAAVYSQGILSDRPVSTSGSPGIDGRLYYVKADSTAANNGILWLDNGTGWDLIAIIPGAGTYADFTPAIVADTTNPTLGSGATAIARYLETGKMVHYEGTIIFGSGMTGGTGAWHITAPVTPKGAGLGTLFITQQSTGPGYVGTYGAIQVVPTAKLQPFAFGTPTTDQISGLDAANPWTWAAGDKLDWSITYEAA